MLMPAMSGLGMHTVSSNDGSWHIDIMIDTTTAWRTMAHMHSMRLHVVRFGESPMRIAAKYTGNPYAFGDLIAANPHKSVTSNGTFATIHVGENINIPNHWSSVGIGSQLPPQPLGELNVAQAHHAYGRGNFAPDPYNPGAPSVESMLDQAIPELQQEGAQIAAANPAAQSLVNEANNAVASSAYALQAFRDAVRSNYRAIYAAWLAAHGAEVAFPRMQAENATEASMHGLGTALRAADQAIYLLSQARATASPSPPPRQLSPLHRAFQSPPKPVYRALSKFSIW